MNLCFNTKKAWTIDNHYCVTITNHNGDTAQFLLDTPLDYITLRAAVDSWTAKSESELRIAIYRCGSDCRNTMVYVPFKDLTLSELAYIASGHGVLRTTNKKNPIGEDLFHV